MPSRKNKSARWLARLPRLVKVILGVFMLTTPLPATAAPTPLPKLADLPFPRLAVTPGELARLRAIWAGGASPERAVLAKTIAQAERALTSPLSFPPRGGQHNQWYQCEPCQRGLETVSDSEHRCPLCGKVYTGEPFDDVIFARHHGQNLAQMLDDAWARAITGEERFGVRARAVLLGYAERYGQYPYHDAQLGKTNKSGGHLNEQTLGEASMTANQFAPAYDLAVATGVLSTADQARITEGLWRPMMANIAKHRAGKNNWQTWHNAALFSAAIVLGDQAVATQALDDPEHGFHFQMGVSVSREGMWYENSWSYHFYTLSALVATAEAARRIGVDLWADTRLRAMCELAARYLMPDGGLPRFADATSSSLRFDAIMEAAAARYGSATLAPLLARETNWHSVLHGRAVTAAAVPGPVTSELLPGAGHALLRTNGPGKLAVAAAFGAHGGFHGHYDKLSFVFYGFGQELGVDPGRALSQAYRLPIHTQWYKATLSHNTVLVDGQSQAEAKGECRLFAANDRFAAVTLACDTAYPGVRHTRTLLLTPEYLLVHDELAATKASSFTWAYHQVAESVNSPVASQTGGEMPQWPGLNYLRQVRQGQTDAALAVAFASPTVPLRLLMAGALETRVLVGDGPLGRVEDRVPLVLVTRTGQHVSFTAILLPGKDAGAWAAPVAERAGTGWTICVSGPGGTDTLQLTPSTLRLQRASTEVLHAQTP